MANIKIIFNNEAKVFPISATYDTELRVWNEFVAMGFETCICFSNDSSAYDWLITNLNNTLVISEFQKQYDKYEEKMISKLIRKIEDKFNKKVSKNNFHWLYNDLTNEEIQDDVCHSFDCFDTALDY